MYRSVLPIRVAVDAVMFIHLFSSLTLKMEEDHMMAFVLTLKNHKVLLSKTAIPAATAKGTSETK